MAIILLASICTFAWFLIDSISEREWFGIFVGIVVTVLVFGLMVLIVGGISECLPESMMNIEQTGIQEIIALKDGKGLVGSFYLYSGYVKDDLYYYYACETDRGYKVEKVNASKCYIIYTDENPRIETYVAESFTNWVSWIYAIPLHRHYILYVPDGTITNEYSINLE